MSRWFTGRRSTSVCSPGRCRARSPAARPAPMRSSSRRTSSRPRSAACRGDAGGGRPFGGMPAGAGRPGSSCAERRPVGRVDRAAPACVEGLPAGGRWRPSGRGKPSSVDRLGQVREENMPVGPDASPLLAQTSPWVKRFPAHRGSFGQRYTESISAAESLITGPTTEAADRPLREPEQRSLTPDNVSAHTPSRIHPGIGVADGSGAGSGSHTGRRAMAMPASHPEPRLLHHRARLPLRPLCTQRTQIRKRSRTLHCQPSTRDCSVRLQRSSSTAEPAGQAATRRRPPPVRP